MRHRCFANGTREGPSSKLLGVSWLEMMIRALNSWTLIRTLLG